jgi:hypothetical protein
MYQPRQPVPQLTAHVIVPSCSQQSLQPRIRTSASSLAFTIASAIPSAVGSMAVHRALSDGILEQHRTDRRLCWHPDSHRSDLIFRHSLSPGTGRVFDLKTGPWIGGSLGVLFSALQRSPIVGQDLAISAGKAKDLRRGAPDRRSEFRRGSGFRGRAELPSGGAGEEGARRSCRRHCVPESDLPRATCHEPSAAAWPRIHGRPTY